MDVIEDFPYPSEEVIQQITAAYSEGRIVDLPDPFGFRPRPVGWFFLTYLTNRVKAEGGEVRAALQAGFEAGF